MSDVLRSDAKSWLAQKDPVNLRSAYSIALEFADKYPGHSRSATVRRIMKKLSAQRSYLTIVEAVSLSEDHYPYGEHLRALAALAKAGVRDDLWRRYLVHVQDLLADYTLKFGAPPAHMTIKQIEVDAAKVIAATPPAGSGNVLQILLVD